MDYQDYLDAWALRFDEAPKGEYDYFIYGERRTVKLHRLSKTEFQEHLKALTDASDAFDVALKADDGKGMDRALAESFKYELALLI